MAVETSASHVLVTQLLEDIAHSEMGMRNGRVSFRTRGRYAEVIIENALPGGLSWDHPASLLPLRLVRQLISDFGGQIRAAVSLDQSVGPVAQSVIDLETAAIRLRFLANQPVPPRRAPATRKSAAPMVDPLRPDLRHLN